MSDRGSGRITRYSERAAPRHSSVGRVPDHPFRAVRLFVITRVESDERIELVTRQRALFLRAFFLGNLIGYWHASEDVQFPHPQSLVDPLWEQDRRSQIVSYLNHGSSFLDYMGYSYCRFGCGNLGSTELTDGTWAWPEGLSHYVEIHCIKLPNEFVTHAASSSFRTPRLRVDYPFEFGDLSFWIEWCKQNTVFKYEPGCRTCNPARCSPCAPPKSSRIDELVWSVELRIKRSLVRWLRKLPRS